MVEISAANEIDVLAERLQRGMDLLFDMESRGDLSSDYERYFSLWSGLLDRYEELQAA